MMIWVQVTSTAPMDWGTKFATPSQVGAAALPNKVEIDPKVPKIHHPHPLLLVGLALVAIVAKVNHSRYPILHIIRLCLKIGYTPYSNGLSSISPIKLLFVGIPYFQTNPCSITSAMACLSRKLVPWLPFKDTHPARDLRAKQVAFGT